MARLSREMKREQQAAHTTHRAAEPIEVRIPAAGEGAGAASVGGVPVAAAPGEEVQQAVLDRLQRMALASGQAVLATVRDERIGYVVPLRVEPDGSSHFTADPAPLAPPASPAQAPIAPASPPALPAHATDAPASPLVPPAHASDAPASPPVPPAHASDAPASPPVPPAHASDAPASPLVPPAHASDAPASPPAPPAHAPIAHTAPAPLPVPSAAHRPVAAP